MLSLHRRSGASADGTGVGQEAGAQPRVGPEGPRQQQAHGSQMPPRSSNYSRLMLLLQLQAGAFRHLTCGLSA